MESQVKILKDKWSGATPKPWDFEPKYFLYDANEYEVRIGNTKAAAESEEALVLPLDIIDKVGKQENDACAFSITIKNQAEGTRPLVVKCAARSTAEEWIHLLKTRSLPHSKRELGMNDSSSNKAASPPVSPVTTSAPPPPSTSPAPISTPQTSNTSRKRFANSEAEGSGGGGTHRGRSRTSSNVGGGSPALSSEPSVLPSFAFLFLFLFVIYYFLFSGGGGGGGGGGVPLPTVIAPEHAVFYETEDEDGSIVYQEYAYSSTKSSFSWTAMIARLLSLSSLGAMTGGLYLHLTSRAKPSLAPPPSGGSPPAPVPTIITVIFDEGGLGLSISDEPGKGVFVDKIAPDGPAGRAGVKEHSRVLRVGEDFAVGLDCPWERVVQEISRRPRPIRISFEVPPPIPSAPPVVVVVTNTDTNSNDDKTKTPSSSLPTNLIAGGFLGFTIITWLFFNQIFGIAATPTVRYRPPPPPPSSSPSLFVLLFTLVLGGSALVIAWGYFSAKANSNNNNDDNNAASESVSNASGGASPSSQEVLIAVTSPKQTTRKYSDTRTTTSVPLPGGDAAAGGYGNSNASPDPAAMEAEVEKTAELFPELPRQYLLMIVNGTSPKDVLDRMKAEGVTPPPEFLELVDGSSSS